MRKNLLRALALVMALMLLIPSFALATGDDVLIEDVDAEQYEETFEMGEDTEPAAPERTGDEDDDILPEDVASDDAANSEVEAPVVREEPTVEAPATEAPATEEPVAEKPAEEEPVAEEPAEEEPEVEEPKAEEPAKEPVAEESAAEEPAAEEPAVEEPVEDEDVEAEYVDIPDEVGVTLVDDAVETEEVFFLGAASETSDVMLGVVDAESGVSDEAMDAGEASDWTVETISAGGTIEGSTITFSGATVNFSAANPSIGRSIDGYWVGVKFHAPDSITSANIGDVQYSNNGGSTWKSFDAAKDSGDTYPAWMEAWVPISADQVPDQIAEWVEQGYTTLPFTYLFDDNGGDHDDAQTFKINYKFDNITLIKDGVVQLKVVDGEVVDMDKDFTVTFNSDGGSDVDAQTVHFNENAIEPTEPTKSGYTFAGWYIDETQFSFSDPIKANTELKAKWDEKPWTVETISAGGTITDNEVTFSGTTVNFSAANPSIGRSIDGYWVGVKFHAPEFITSANIGDVQYSNNGGSTWKSFDAAKDSGTTYPAWMEAWVPISADQVPDQIAEWVEQGYTTLPFTYLFDNNGGDHDDAQTFKINYKFDNITLIKDGVVQLKVVDGEVVDMDKDFTVTFDSDGGSDIDAQTVHYKKNATEPSNPTKDYYTFNGWTLNEEPFDFDTPIEADIKLVADWTINQYTITFANTGDTTVKPITLDYGAKVTAPANPTREGYTFGGWDVAIPETMPAEDLTVTAKWTINQYTITFADTGDDDNYPTWTMDYDSPLFDLDPGTPEREGYTFVGWDPAIPETMPAENLTITAKWKAEMYTITFSNTGDTAIAPITQEFGSKVTAPANPTWAGHTFIGWDEDIPATMPSHDMYIWGMWQRETYTVTFKDADGKIFSQWWAGYGDMLFDPGMPEREGYTFVGWDPAIPETMPAKDLTFTPKWKADKHTITFINTGDTTIKPITLDYGTKVTAPANPTKLGYTFTGWNTAIPATMPSFDMMIFADWRLNKYTITFANTGDTTVKPITLDYSAKVTAPADPTRKGYTFTGWDVAIPATMPAENLTITAKWKVNQYTITFADTGDTAVKPITLDYGAKVTAPANPTREGYTFGGWDVAIPETMPAEDLTITATWNPVPTDRGSLIATAKNAGATSIKLSWTAVPDVDGYDIFLSQCNHGGETLVTEYVATVGADQKVYTAKGLKKNTFYKMNVRAFVMQDGEKFYIAKSPTAHLATGKYSGNQCNAKAVKLATKSKVSLKVGKTRKIKASVTKSVSSKKLVNHVAKLRYVSSNPSVASVSSAGKIMAVGKGSCVIYCIAPNGVYKTVKVTVK